MSNHSCRPFTHMLWSPFGLQRAGLHRQPSHAGGGQRRLRERGRQRQRWDRLAAGVGFRQPRRPPRGDHAGAGDRVLDLQHRGLRRPHAVRDPVYRQRPGHLRRRVCGLAVENSHWRPLQQQLMLASVRCSSRPHHPLLLLLLLPRLPFFFFSY